MSQQINLYQPIFRKQKKIFSAVTIMQTAAVFAVGLACIYGYASWQMRDLDQTIASLEQRRDHAMMQLQTLTVPASPTTRNGSLEGALRAARTEQQRLAAVMVALEGRTFGDTRGFSGQFVALARQRVNGLWLTRVLIRDGGIELEGAMESARLLPRYLERLGREESFVGTQFAWYELQRGEEPGAPVSFAMSTAAVKDSE